jgi:hypothetical protein
VALRTGVTTCADFDLYIKIGSLGVPLMTCAGLLYESVPVHKVFMSPGQQVSVEGADDVGGQLTVGDATVAALSGGTVRALQAGTTTVWINHGSVTCIGTADQNLPTKDCVLFEVIVN